MIYLFVILGIFVVIGVAASFRMYLKGRRQSSSSSSVHKKHPHVSSYELSVWIDDEVGARQLYRKPDITAYELSQELGLDERLLRRAISNAYDKSVHDYLNERRIQAASRLLREKPDMTIEEIRLETGFSSLKSFQTIFTSLMGLTPDKYRILMLSKKI